MKRRKQLFDVLFVPPKLKIVRVLATDEMDAGEIAVGIFETGTAVKSPDRRQRTVYEWRRYKGVVPVTQRKRGVK